MTSTSTHFKHILNRLQQKRLKNLRLHTKRKETLYQAYPKLHTIDYTIASKTKKITLDCIQNPSHRASLMTTLQEDLAQLGKERTSLLEAAGYPSNYLEPIYTCSNCQDTGYVQDKRCHCLTQELINYAYAHSNLDTILEDENFDTFSLDYYSQEIDAQLARSPRDIAEQNYQICYDFAYNFGESYQNLILYGQAGLGKTFLCHAIAKEVLDRAHTVVYLTAFDFFRLVENYRFHNNENTISIDDLNTIYHCDLLILDDLGTEVNNAFTASELFNLINTRLTHKKPIVISTNLSPKDWAVHYSDRIISRIYGNYLSLAFIGADIRLQNLLK